MSTTSFSHATTSTLARAEHHRRGGGNPVLWFFIASVLIVSLLFLMLLRKPPGTAEAKELVLYCAAGMRYPMQEIITKYQQEYGVTISAQFQGSNTLLAQIEVSKTGDLYLAADSSYVELARQKGLAQESLSLAHMKPVIVVHKDNKTIHSIDDLISPQHRVALGNPDAAAIGKKTRKLLTTSGHWEALNANVTKHGVYKPTVNEVATDVRLGSVHAGVIWDATAIQFPDLKQISCPALDAGDASIEICVLKSSKHPTAALKFARYIAARDRGLQTFGKKGFRIADGDVWEEHPELTFFAGSVNSRALKSIITSFEQREGVTVNTVYNGCGILTSQMRSMAKNKGKGFPDSYMACDVYYLKAVQDLFEEGIHVSDTDIMLVVQKGNPKQIRQVSDLTRDGIRVAIGHPEQCTIGVLSRRLLEEAHVYQAIKSKGNVVTETASSALLIPNITTGAADAVLAYRSDTLAEREKLEVVAIESDLAKAIQPYSTARSSQHKALSGRLFDTIARSRDQFEKAGFNWRLDQSSNAPGPRDDEK
ncbi:MAG TPA: molybdate ABC transporter substrate-binding protein [Planctomycetaceae bacterium]|nr:molybdate ABC transporter substrate-binding protein [Planctomycetaceae bacterium]